MSLEDRIIRIYQCNATSLKKFANKNGIPLEYCQKVVKRFQEEEREYRKTLNSIYRSLPRHNDKNADDKWRKLEAQF